ncbi:MAG: PLP-dependent aspartate aminotransferase family protein [Candidatus Hydrogenedentota bacterium]
MTSEPTDNDSGSTGFETKAIHAGLGYSENTGSVIPPAYLSSTFAHGNPEGFDYTRSGNPNFKNLEATLSSLENAEYATVFASGVSAITAVVSTLKSGDTVVAEENIYGCTYRLFAQVFEKFGVEVTYVDLTEPENFAVIESTRPALVWIESPTNPLLKIVDISAIAEKAHGVGATVVVDNTFASSYFQKPLALGADLSLTSTTKYSNGHSDSLGGVVVTDSLEWQDKMVFAQKAMGLHPAPFDTWLIARGVKTMAVRMERHQENALAIAQFLESHGKVKWVRYPLLESHPQFELAKRQMTGGSGIVTANFDLTLEETHGFLRRLRYFTLAESLGGIESLICHPATMTHASIPKEIREEVGITDSLVRFSVGIETVVDLIEDLKQALG